MCRGASCRALSENRCKSRDPTKQRDRMIKCRRASTEVNAANRNKTVLIARDGAERMNSLCPRGRRKMFSVYVLARALEIKAVLYDGIALIAVPSIASATKLRFRADCCEPFKPLALPAGPSRAAPARGRGLGGA